MERPPQAPSSTSAQYPELATIAAAKRLGLSFDELNRFTMSEWLDFIDIWIGDNEQDDTVRPATQADIDRFF